MKRFVIASALICTFVVPAWALEAGVHYVGLDTTTHTCSVMTEMKAGMKMMENISPRKKPRRPWPE